MHLKAWFERSTEWHAGNEGDWVNLLLPGAEQSWAVIQISITILASHHRKIKVIEVERLLCGTAQLRQTAGVARPDSGPAVIKEFTHDCVT